MDQKVVIEYVTWLRSWGASEATVRARKSFAAGRVRDWTLDGFTVTNVQEFMANPELARWSRATYFSHLTDLCKWLTAAGYIPADPMISAKKPRRPQSRPKPLSEREVELVLAEAIEPVRDWIILALFAGLRVSEIARMRGQDITREGIYVQGKGGNTEVLPCHAEIRAMALKYPTRGYWFPGTDRGHVASQYISRDVAKVFRVFNIEGSCHRARHTYATRLLRAGTNIRKVQRLMRHSALETTAGYTAVDEDELQAAIDALPLPPAA